MALHIFYLTIFLYFVMTTAAAVTGQPVDDSDSERVCGDVSVPYPFGWRDSDKCYKDANYKLTYNYTLNPPLYLGKNLPIFNISIEDATAVVGVPTAFACYEKSGVSQNFSQNASLGTTPFLFSTRNKFMAIGCDTVAFIGDRTMDRFTTGCLSVCSSNNIKGLDNPYNFTQELINCEGIGCCQTQVPKQLNTLYISLDSISNHSTQLDTNPCSFGFLADPTWYKDVADFTLVTTF